MERKRMVKTTIAVTMFICLGFGIAAVITNGIDYVIAQDIHKIVIDDPALSSSAPNRANTINPNYETGIGITPAPGVFSTASTAKKVLGEYSTEFSAGAKARNTNIKKAAESLDNTIIQPGETFSYNDTLGPTTKENGYARARIFIRGTKSYGYGGGVCQVSSTLYNAVLEAGLKVTERHPHSLPVTYVPKDKDAATSYGSVDFKFVNNLSYPVEINASVSGSSVTCQIVS
ncbi:MAG: VanW family protein [Clostridiales bacterium]|jgi:vancomycin resistance protein YoaR|nr:VanW family protein [Clostridiales bacterium]